MDSKKKVKTSSKNVLKKHETSISRNTKNKKEMKKSMFKGMILGTLTSIGTRLFANLINKWTR